jgi:hypothetical protein
LLLAHGRTLKQVQGLLGHAQLTTALNAYITEVDDGLGGADHWDEILAVKPPQEPSGGPEGGPSGLIEAGRRTENPDETYTFDRASDF